MEQPRSRRCHHQPPRQHHCRRSESTRRILLTINGDYDQALVEYQIARQQAGDEDTRLRADLGIARIYYLKRRSSHRLTLLRTLVDAYPNNLKRANAFYYLGQIYSTLGRYAEAATAFDEFLKLRPGEIDSAIQDLKGDALSAAGDTIGAINAYLAAIQLPHLGGQRSLEYKTCRRLSCFRNPEIAIQIYQQVFDSTINITPRPR